MTDHNISRVIYNAFRDTEAYLSDLHAVYRNLYPTIPSVSYVETVRDQHAFDYCKARSHFVLVLPYTNQRELLAERSFAHNELVWTVLGGSLRRDWQESFIDAANRHASRAMHGVLLGEIEPIAFLTNTFEYGDARHVHEGIAFVARVRNADPYRDLSAARYSRGYFVPLADESITFSLSHNDAVVRLAREYVQRIDFKGLAELEISENLKYRTRYALNDRIVKKVFRYASRLPIFEDSIEGLYRRTDDAILAGSHSKILDVACGDNDGVFSFGELEGVELVVRNDVSWSQIELMRARFPSHRLRNRKSFVLLTNHDARHMPFGDSVFDVAYCKNTLHHMEDHYSAIQLLAELRRVARRVVIVEVMDPTYESWWGRLRHRYYTDWLHDAGHNFLSSDEFNSLTDLPEHLDRFDVRTMRGVYQFAVLGERQPTDDS